MPKRLRRWSVLLAEARFTVTAGAVVMDKHGRVLLLEHRFRPGSGWGIPGGFIHPREQPEDAVRRELQEEIGLDIEGLEVAFTRTLERYQQVEIIFRCHSCGDAQPRNYEISRAEWFTPHCWPVGLSEEQCRLLERVLGESSEICDLKSVI